MGPVVSGSNEETRASEAPLPLTRGMRLPRPRAFALVVALGLFFLLCGIDFTRTLHATDGRFIYPLDDSYIGMAIAKNFAGHGTWGVTPYAFSSTTSSPLFTLLLALGYWLTGPNIWLPVLMSFLFGAAAVVAADRLLPSTCPLGLRTAGLLAIVVFTPLPTIGLSGMEHTFHLLLVLLFLKIAVREIAERTRPSFPLLLLVAAMVMVRYESLFLIFVAMLVCCRQRCWQFAARLGIAAALPVLAYGLVSVAHGFFWLPNPIALKGVNTTSIKWMLGSLLLRVIENGIAGVHLFELIVILELLRRRAALQVGYARQKILLDLVAGAAVLHLLLAKVGWLYRYEAYLVAAGIAVFCCIPPELMRNRRSTSLGVFAVGIACVLALSVRARTSLVNFPLRCDAIYRQQYQMARFVQRYYDHSVVAANDIGAITYMTDVHLMDLFGLADKDVFFAKRQHRYTTDFMAREAARQGVEIAIVYDSWFQGDAGIFSETSGPRLPAAWIRVARWKTPHGTYLGSDTVSFYAVRNEEAPRLRERLREFSSSLPAAIEVFED